MNPIRTPRNLRPILLSLALTSASLSWFPARLIAHHPASKNTSAPQPSAEPQQPSATNSKTASEVYVNLKVLKEIPADQFMPSMRYITTALGVRCEYCHDPDHFDTDDKPEKERARNMMKMMMAINRDNFSGRREVSCFTCHRGAAKAANLPPLADQATATALPSAPPDQPSTSSRETAASPSGPAVGMPTAGQILEKYFQALGGHDALQKMGTRVEKGTVDIPARGVHAAIETYRKAPNMAFAVQHTPHGDATEGFNGNIGWQQRPGGKVSEIEGDELARTMQWADFYLGQSFKQEYSRFQFHGTEMVGGRDAYRILCWWPSGRPDRIFFDVQSGLLLRIAHCIDSALGALPLQTDYEDYRDVQGAKIPFVVRVTRAISIATYKWDQIEADVSIKDSLFENPSEKPVEKQKNTR